MNIPEFNQPGNIYVPGIPGMTLPDRLPDNHNIYTDHEVSLLPDLRRSHPRFEEWSGREVSAGRLIRYLSAQKEGAGILEIGCGNGWLSHRLSVVPGSRVIGLDRNLGELRQAARVFRRQSNLKFICGDFYSAVLQDLSFDIIVMAATVHRFSSASRIIGDALGLLRPGGELHVLDSPIRRNTLHGFRHLLLYNPHSFWNRFFRADQTHPWICFPATRLPASV